MSARWHVAQMNVARMRYPLRDPRMADFLAEIETVNSLADRSPGFVWRIEEYLDVGDAVQIAGAEDLLVNMSVWEDVESLWAFTYENAEHLAVLRRRKDWFDRLDLPPFVLWWRPADAAPPTVEEGIGRLEVLAANGPGPDAFTFKERFPAPDAAAPHVRSTPGLATP